MLRLYFIPGRSWLPRWLLEELDQPYELVRLDRERGEHKQPAYLKINPLGKAPSLEINGQVMNEGAAICLYLADRYSTGRLALAGDEPERPRYLALMVHASAALDPSISDWIFKRKTVPAEVGWGTVAQELAFLEGQLGHGPFLFGERFSAADVMIGGTLIWGRLAGLVLPESLQAYTGRLLQRPKLVALFDEVGGVPV